MRLGSIFSWLLLAINIMAYLISSHVGFFDASIFRLQLVYPTVGIFPEKDFIIFYPFGLSLISKLVNFLSAGLIDPVTLIWPIHFLLQLKLLRSLEQLFTQSNYLPAICLVLMLETVGFAVVGTEPFSLIISIIILLELYKLDLKITSCKALIAWLVMLIFLRWDRFLYTMAAWACYLIVKEVKSGERKLVTNAKFILYYFYAFVIFLSAIYLYEPKYFLRAIEHIFYDPFLIAHYRSKHFVFDYNLLNINNWYLLILAFYLMLLLKNIHSKFNSPKVIFYLIGLCFIPYTLTRPDISHFFPFIISSSIAFVLILDKLDYSYLKMANMAVLIAAVLFCLFQNSHKPIDTCSNFPTNDYKSIFVGNNDYGNFVINFPIIYLNKISIKPATKYITDEPGLQNRCDIQKEMVDDFSVSEKPTIFYLNHTPIDDKNNSNTFNGCQLIHQYLVTKTERVGECLIGENLVEIRMED